VRGNCRGGGTARGSSERAGRSPAILFVLARRGCRGRCYRVKMGMRPSCSTCLATAWWEWETGAGVWRRLHEKPSSPRLCRRGTGFDQRLDGGGTAGSGPRAEWRRGKKKNWDRNPTESPPRAGGPKHHIVTDAARCAAGGACPRPRTFQRTSPHLDALVADRPRGGPRRRAPNVLQGDRGYRFATTSVNRLAGPRHCLRSCGPSPPRPTGKPDFGVFRWVVEAHASPGLHRFRRLGPFAMNATNRVPSRPFLTLGWRADLLELPQVKLGKSVLKRALMLLYDQKRYRVHLRANRFRAHRRPSVLRARNSQGPWWPGYRRVMPGKFTADALCRRAWRPPCSPMGRLCFANLRLPRPWVIKRDCFVHLDPLSRSKLLRISLPIASSGKSSRRLENETQTLPHVEASFPPPPLKRRLSAARAELAPPKRAHQVERASSSSATRART